MPVVRTLVSAIPFSLSLFATSLAFQPGALAQARSAYQEQIAAFTPKLEKARSTQADLSHLAVCLDQRDANLVQQRGQLEVRLGQLRTEEKSLAPKVQTLETAYQQYKVNFENERKKVVPLEKTVEKMVPNAHERYQRRACLGASLQIACMGYNRGLFETVDAKLQDALRREQIARDSMDAAEQNLNASKRQLTTARSQLNSTGLEIGQTEKAIVRVKQSLSDVRDLVQPLRIVIDEFANALNKAKDVNLADERPRTLRKLGDIAAAVDATMARGHAAAAHADETLGVGWMKSCKVN
jgi:chromosome segregation ATPase